MRKSFLVIVFICISLISMVFSTSEECGTTGLYKCPSGQTCCRSKNGDPKFKCYEVTEGVCGSDGLSICPKNTKFDSVKITCEPL